MIRRLPFLVFLFYFIGNQSILSQTYWGNKAGSPSIEQGLGVTTDAAGNTYATGYFTSICNFGGTSLSASGLSDIFIAKYDPTGNLLWVQKYGGAADERARAIALDNSGNILLTGHFSGSTTIGSTTFTSSGLDDVLTIKLDNNGNVIWARAGGGTGADLGHDITSDAAGNVIITGEIFNTATFGASVLNGVNADVFIVKYDPSGNILWTQLGTGNFTDKGFGISVDASNNIYICGPFSDTITFDIAHPTPYTNVSFLVKFDPNGNELWFRHMGGGTMCVANDLDVLNNEVYVTGDFTSSMSFFNTAIPILNPTYANRIFVASYSLTGTGNWGKADASESLVSSRTIEANSSGIYIGGHFRCTFNDYADVYGSGTFNSVGNYDCFMTRYSSSGTRQWMRQWGGRGNDFCWDLGIGTSGEPVITGDFEGRMNVPIQGTSFPNMHNTDLNNCGIVTQTTAYCSDNNYSVYARWNSAGNYDMFVGRLIDPARETYDYYERFGSGCTRPRIEPCLEGGPNYNCPDTVVFCSPGSLTINSYANANQCIGPVYNYTYSPVNYTNITTNGYYVCTTTRPDGCYTWTDSIYVVIRPNPTRPPISDAVPVNTASLDPEEVHLCGDSVLIWSTSQGYTTYGWVGHAPQTTSLMVTASGTYSYQVTNQYGCSEFNSVDIFLEDSLNPVSDLTIICPNDTDGNDSLTFCAGDQAGFDILDSITLNSTFSDWGGAYTLYIPGGPAHQDSIVTHVPDIPFSVTNTGWYVVEVDAAQFNSCDTIHYLFTDSIYIEVNPLPNLVVSITPPITHACFGDTVTFVGSSSIPGVTLTWFAAPPLISLSNDTAVTTSPGNVFIMASYTDSLGCSASASASGNVSEPIPPVITSSSLIICPGDSVLLICNPSGGVIFYQWYGPQGPLTLNNDSLYLSQHPGFYYCAVLDSLGCTLYSNTVEVIQYTTPDMFVSPDNLICVGQDSAVIYLAGTLGSTINWLPPLSGSDTSQTITQPGTYYCQFTTCGTITMDSVTIVTPGTTLSIYSTGYTFFCHGDSVRLTAIDTNIVTGIVWDPSGDSGNSIWAYESGNYTATGTDTSGCLVTSNPIPVTANSNPTPAPIVEDIVFCPVDQLIFEATGGGVIFWYDSANAVIPIDTGTTFMTPVLTAGASYWVEQILDSCYSERIEVKAIAVTCDDIEIPNVFSPNGDGFNDFIDFYLMDAKCFELDIYNRWGISVFHSNDPAKQWTGYTDEGTELVEGVYFWVIHYCPKNVPPKKKSGFIHLFK